MSTKPLCYNRPNKRTKLPFVKVLATKIGFALVIPQNDPQEGSIFLLNENYCVVLLLGTKQQQKRSIS